MKLDIDRSQKSCSFVGASSRNIAQNSAEKQSTATAPPFSNFRGCRLRLSNDYERQLFLYGLQVNPSIVSDIRSIEIHLDARLHNEYVDDKLAIALAAFHPSSTYSPLSPHNLQLIKIVLSGDVLFTRHTYHLVSPAVSGDVLGDLHKFMNAGALSRTEQANLPFKVNSTEKTFARALLGIRSVPRITFEERGKARIESCFKKQIQRTLILPPGVHPSPASETSFEEGTEDKEYSMSAFYGKGEFYSRNYFVKEQPYPTRDYAPIPDSERGKQKVCLDEKTLMLGNFLGRDKDAVQKEAKSTFNARSRGLKRKRFREESFSPPSDYTSPNGHRTRAKRREISGLGAGELSEGQMSEGRGLHDMVRIGGQKQDGEDLGTSKNGHIMCWINQHTRGIKTDYGEWLGLTGKGAQITLGWSMK